MIVLERCDQLRQQRLALDVVDGGWQGKGRAIAQRVVPVTVVEIAERGEPRQQGGLAIGGAQEGLAQRAHRASGRHQDQHLGERHWIAAVLGEQAVSQFVGEATVDANGEDTVHRKTCSASRNACSVPMWNHWPSWSRP